MRVLLAGVFVFVGVSLSVALFGNWLEHGSPARIIVFGIGNGLLVIALCIAAIFLFNKPFGHPAEFQTAEQYIKGLEDHGLLISTGFQAVRAFQVEECEDEGLHYFIELADGTVLYLTGQDLYDYEPIEDDPELNQPRRFPCTEFALRTHRDEKFVVDIQCRGAAIEPAYVAPCPKDYWKWEPEDGQVITGETYDEIKQRIVTAAAEAQPS